MSLDTSVTQGIKQYLEIQKTEGKYCKIYKELGNTFISKNLIMLGLNRELNKTWKKSGLITYLSYVHIFANISKTNIFKLA